MDGVGKSTVARTLAEGLRSSGRSVEVVHHPNRDTRLGRMSVRFLLKRGRLAMAVASGTYFLDLLFSLTRMKLHKKRFDDRVFVRYTMSVCYLSDRMYMRMFRLLRFFLPEQDVRILVDADADTAMGRIGGRGEELEMFENPEKLSRVRDNMLSVAEADGWRVFSNTGTQDDIGEFVHSFLSE